MVLVLLACGAAAAAEDESGGEPLPILRFGTTARVWGMGNAGVAAARGVEGLYHNPAALAYVVRPELSISHSRLGEASDPNFAAAALPITDRGSLGADSLLSSAGIPRTPDDIDNRLQAPLITSRQLLHRYRDGDYKGAVQV